MNKFEKALERVKHNAYPNEKWTEEDFEHYNTVVEALEIASDLCKVNIHPTEKVCTGKRCPMQVGYDVSNCKDKECIYRTETEKGGVEK